MRPRPPSLHLPIVIGLLMVTLSGCLGDEATPRPSEDAAPEVPAGDATPPTETTVILLDEPYALRMPREAMTWNIEIPHNATQITLHLRTGIYAASGLRFAVGDCAMGDAVFSIGFTGTRSKECPEPPTGPANATVTAIAGVVSGRANVTALLTG